MVERPREPRLLWEELTAGTEEALVFERSHDGVRFVAPDLTGERVLDRNLVECLLVGAVLDDADLSGGQWRETRWEAPRATSVKLAGSRWREVEFADGRIGACELFDSDLAVVSFHEMRVDYLNLRGGNITDLALVGGSVGTLDLTEASATRLAVRDCRIDELVLTRAQLSEVDLRGAELVSVVGLAGLKGATISPAQLVELAPLLAEEWGIDVG